MKKKIRILIITALCIVVALIGYATIEQVKIKQNYADISKTSQESSQCLLAEAISSKNISEICSTKLFNYSLYESERGIKYSKILCNNDFLESCEDINFLNSSWTNLTNNSLKNKTRPLKECLREYNESCEDWIEIADVVGDLDLKKYLQGESCINEYYENTKSKSSLTKCLYEIKAPKIFSISTNLEFYNELCSKPCSQDERCPEKEECTRIQNILKLQAIITPSLYEEGLGTIEKNKLLENILQKSPTSQQLQNICKENEFACSEYFNNSITQMTLLESELSLNENKVNDSSNIKLFFETYVPSQRKINSISKFWTEFYRMRRAKKIEELALTAINTYSNKSVEEKIKLKRNYISEFRYNSDYDSNIFKTLEKSDKFKDVFIDKLYFEPIDSYTPEVNERIKKYFCDGKSQNKRCSLIFKNIKEARNNISILKSFCSLGDVMSCELSNLDSISNSLVSPSNIITALKYNYKKEVQSSFSYKITNFISENLKVFFFVFIIIISFLVLFLTYTYFSHIELINHFKAAWKKDADKKADSLLSKLNKSKKHDKESK